jgi:hypothetical protein
MTQAEVLRNARAAHREQVRNEVLADTVILSLDPTDRAAAIEAEVDRRIALVRAKGGRTSQAKRADEIELARRVLAALPALIANHEAGLNELRRIAASADAA